MTNENRDKSANKKNPSKLKQKKLRWSIYYLVFHVQATFECIFNGFFLLQWKCIHKKTSQSKNKNETHFFNQKKHDFAFINSNVFVFFPTFFVNEKFRKQWKSKENLAKSKVLAKFNGSVLSFWNWKSMNKQLAINFLGDPTQNLKMNSIFSSKSRKRRKNNIFFFENSKVKDELNEKKCQKYGGFSRLRHFAKSDE